MSGIASAREVRWTPAPARIGLKLMFACLGVLWTSGCDSRPTGPGSVTVSVEWTDEVQPLGAALVFLGGPGLGQVDALDGAMVWSHTPPTEEGGRRVLIVHTGEPSTLRFSVRLEDVSHGPPQATLLLLATQANQSAFPSEGYRVRVLGP